MIFASAVRHHRLPGAGIRCVWISDEESAAPYLEPLPGGLFPAPFTQSLAWHIEHLLEHDSTKPRVRVSRPDALRRDRDIYLGLTANIVCHRRR